MPVEHVSWDQAHALCTAVGMRLPTEAEYASAARGAIDAARYAPLAPIAWYRGNSGAQPIPSGKSSQTLMGCMTCWETSGSGSPIGTPPPPQRGLSRPCATALRLAAGRIGGRGRRGGVQRPFALPIRATGFVGLFGYPWLRWQRTVSPWAAHALVPVTALRCVQKGCGR